MNTLHTLIKLCTYKYDLMTYVIRLADNDYDWMIRTVLLRYIMNLFLKKC